MSRDGKGSRDAASQPPSEEPGGSDGSGGPLGQRFREGLDGVEARMSPRWQSRTRIFRERIRSQPLLDTAWRVGVFALGVSLLIAGVVMFVIPGPGWATIILGLVVLASEFAWASRALDPVKAAARRAADAALDPKRRKRNLALASLAGVVCAIAVVWYLTVYGATLAPLLSLFQSVVDRIVEVFR